MTTKEKITVSLIAFSIGLTVGIFGMFGHATARLEMQELKTKKIKQEAVDRGYATYKPITEEWKWKDNVIVVEKHIIYDWLRDKKYIGD